MKEIKFTIITVCYNSSKTIARTIDSIVNQTYHEKEYYIIDGASTDDTLNIIRGYQEQYPDMIRSISEPDKGIYDAMNKGIKMATGEIIGIVNSDDWLEPDALLIVNEFIQNNNCDMESLYCGGINYHFSDGSVKKATVDIQSLHRNAKMFIVSGIRHPGLFVPRKVYEEVGVYNDNMRLSADIDFMLRCYYRGNSFLDMNAIVSNMAEGGISTSGSQKAREISRNDRKIMLESFGKRGLSFYWLYYTWYIRGLIKRFVKKIGLYR